LQPLPLPTSYSSQFSCPSSYGHALNLRKIIRLEYQP
jgi:hypothetical protein